MVVWFTSLATVGILSILEAPEVLKALNPYYGIKFLSDNGFIGFIALGEIILCATGGEALYADMGHLGGKPIRQAWSGVFIALVLNYLGQGAFLLRYPETKTVLFEMVLHYAKRSVYSFSAVKRNSNRNSLAGNDKRNVLNSLSGDKHENHAYV